jgi:ligand-binding sensor domain-containing protein
MKIYLFLFLFLLHCRAVKAQSDNMFFHLFLDKGLSDARITAITQDKLGFMWFATPNGLNRYDGYSIKTYYAGKMTGLPSNYIRSLFSDSKGTLWIGTDKGLAKYNFTTETFEHTGIFQAPSFTSVYCFTEDTKGNIYAGTSEGLFCWSRKKGTWENLSIAFKVPKRLKLIKGLLFINEHDLFASTEKKSFYKLNITTRTLDTFGFKVGNIDEPRLSMFGMEKLNSEEILVGTLSFGLIKFSTRTKLFSWPKGVLQKQSNILFNTVTQIKKDHAGRFWVASNYFRLAEYLPVIDSVVSMPEYPDNPFGFTGKNASCIYEDRQHNIWIGTSLNGVYHFNPNQKRVRFYHGNNAEAGSLQSGKVLSIAPLDNNTLMVGTNNGPSIYTRSTNSFINFKGQAFNFGDKALEQVTSGLKDRHGMVWMGSIRLGLMRYDPSSKAIRVFGRFTKPIPFQDDGITDMLETGGDSLLVIGYGQPAFFNTKNFTSHSHRNDSITPLYQLNDVSDLSYDQEHKNIWLSVITGSLYEYDPLTKKLTDRSYLIKTSSKPTALYKIAFDTLGRLWCATNIGAICLDNKKIIGVYSLNTDKSTSTEIKNILPIGKDVWLTNDRSIARLNTLTGRIIILGERDGFNGVQLFGNSLKRSPWNTILIGSNSGFYEIFPDKITDEHTTSSAYLTAFSVYDKPFATSNAISMMKQIDLSYRQNFFSFDISAFDYREANDMEYAYKLEGFDKDWIYIGRQRSGSYTNVPGGKYTLRLKVRNSSGIWNEQGQVLNIYISKPFWETWWFISLIIFVVAGIIFLIYINRIKSIRRQARLRSDYEIKLNELENSALRTQMNPHFIFNSLNTINSFINRNEPAMANQYISKFSKLIRLILDHSREKKITLADELEVVDLYVKLERIRFDNKFDYKIEVFDSIDPDSIEIPPLIVQPFVENAILHGLLPLPSGGMLQVNVSRQQDHLLLIIEDNGIGREKAKEHKLPSADKQKSHGIEITLKRIELFNKDHNFNGKVAFEDLKDKAGLALGTRVSIPVAWEESF